MLFRRTLVRELTNYSLGLFFGILSIVMTFSLLKILNIINENEAPPLLIFPVFFFKLIELLPLLLPISVLLAISLSLNRSEQHSEMTIWFSSGISIFSWIKYALLFSLPTALILSVCSFYTTPWANQQYLQYLEKVQSNDNIIRIQTGIFREIDSLDAVLFMTSSNQNSKSLNNVFLSKNNTSSGALVAVTAKTAELNQDNDTQQTTVTIRNGRYLSINNPPEEESKQIDFETYTFSLPELLTKKTSTNTTKSTNTLFLISNIHHKANQAELYRRIATPISLLLLVILTVVLTTSNQPRQHTRAWSILTTTALFLLQEAITFFLSNKIEREQFTFLQAILILYLPLLTVIVGLLLLKTKSIPR